MADGSALARLRADLAEAVQRRKALGYRHAVATHTSSSTESTDDLDVELARADATIAELEERQAELAEGAAPAPATAPLDAPAGAVAPAAGFIDTAEAATLLGVSVKTLESLRARGEARRGRKLDGACGTSARRWPSGFGGSSAAAIRFPSDPPAAVPSDLSEPRHCGVFAVGRPGFEPGTYGLKERS